MINPLWLRTLQTLIDTGHFTRTAEKLFMTQPGVSQHIKKLEQACGYKLIERDKKNFEVTEQGWQVYHYAKQLQNQEAQMLSQLQPDHAYSGFVSLSCSGALALLLYPQLLNLQCKHPELITQIEAAPNRKILADILSGETDLGIVTQAPQDKRYVIEPLSREPLCLMLPIKYQKIAFSASSLSDLGLIAHPDAEQYLSLYLTHCGDEELAQIKIDQLPRSGYVNQLSQILLPVAKGLGFTVLPKSALDGFSQKDQVYVHQALQVVDQPLYLVSKQKPSTPLRFKTVIDTIKATLHRHQ